jgi:hypothetical protein
VVGLRNLRNPKASFSKVRLFGTVGWVFAGFAVEVFLSAKSPDPLWFSAGLSVVMGLYCFTLPNTPPSGKAQSLGAAFGLPALKLFRDRSFALLILTAMVFTTLQQFYVYANKFLGDIGTPWPTAVQTLAQVSEVACMIVLPMILTRVGMKRIMVIGLIAFILRNGLFVTLSVPIVAGIALPMHGVSYAFFVLVISLYLDEHAPHNLRASAQGIVTFATMGMGGLLGNWLCAEVINLHDHGTTINWEAVWWVPTCGAIVMTLIFLVFFKVNPHPSPEVVTTPTPANPQVNLKQSGVAVPQDA